MASVANCSIHLERTGFKISACLKHRVPRTRPSSYSTQLEEDAGLCPHLACAVPWTFCCRSLMRKFGPPAYDCDSSLPCGSRSTERVSRSQELSMRMPVLLSREGVTIQTSSRPIVLAAPRLDCLRGLAVFLVLLHRHQLQLWIMGVDLFLFLPVV